MTAFLMGLMAITWSVNDDFSWINGANYIPSYAATDVELWLNYEHDTIARELGYGERLGFNCVRVFLQSLVYQHNPERFLSNLEDFVACADAHGMKTMPILFNSCFGVSPSLESQHMWVANPGQERMAQEFWPDSEKYARDVVSSFVGDPRVVMWDVMNEPSATPLAVSEEGRKLIYEFLVHHCKLVRELDPTHPITVGVATHDNSYVLDLVDVLSCHSYAPELEKFSENLMVTRKQAEDAGKPWIVSECCAPGWGSHYEMVMPELRRMGVGHTIWELMIGKIQFRNVSGLFYPDGTVRRISQIEAVMNKPAVGFVEKSDEEGVPILRQAPGRLAEYVEFMARNPVTEMTWRERMTAVQTIAQTLNVFGDGKEEVLEELDAAVELHSEGESKRAYEIVGKLMAEANDKIKPAGTQVPPPPSATIHRDTYGVPHIYADTEEALYYALARAMCQDAAPRVFANLRIGVGMLPEVEGDAALNWAKLARQLQVKETAEQTWAESSLRLRRNLTAFCAGLNDYRAEHPEECKNALEATPVQVLAWGKFVLIMPSMSIASIDANNTLAGTDEPVFDTSHSSTWVAGPDKTAEGAPIVLVDPHWPAQGPLSFYEAHLYAGRLDVGGFMVHGFPFVVLGYTPGVAWGMTAGGADAADAFELKINPENSDQYMWDNEWRDMDIVEEEIPVADGDGIRMESCRFRYSVHGPVFKEQDGRVFAAALCRWRDTRFAEQFWSMGLARTKDELMDAMALDQLPWLNFCYGTSEGHFGYIQLGCCPIRPERPGLFVALDGTTSRTLWQGVVPLDELPQVHNPASGFVQSCNTAANEATTGLDMKPEDFAPGALFGHYGAQWRGRGMRSTEVLSGAEGFTLEDGIALALDTLTPAARFWQKPLIESYGRFRNEIQDAPEELDKAAEAVREWDGRVVRESIGATVFRFWREAYAEKHPEAVGDGQANAYPKTEEEQRDAMTALVAAVKRLQEIHGTALSPWGDMMRLRRGSVDLPLSGDASQNMSEVMRATGTGVLTDEGRFVFNGGQVVTTVVQLTDPIQVYSIVPFGQSSKADSPHFTDQMRLYSEDQMRPAWHDWEQLKGNIESSETITYTHTRGKKP